MSEGKLKEKYKTIIDILSQIIEKNQGYLFHIWMHKLIKDYQKDYYIVPITDSEEDRLFDLDDKLVTIRKILEPTQYMDEAVLLKIKILEVLDGE